jgi:RHS repeat-associated protein
MNFVSSSSGFDQVGADQEFKHHVLSNLPIDKSGYLYIYLSNETPNIAVFFDNLQVTHVRGPLLEENNYYPFGLSMSGLSDKVLRNSYSENKHLYNGKEMQNREFSDGTGLELYDFGARFYDSQLGRFFTPDAYTEMYHSLSPYQYGANDPVKNIDNNGDSILTFFYNKKGELTNTIPEQVQNTFAQEYGIELGYNSDTHMLYGSEIKENQNEGMVDEMGQDYDHIQESHSPTATSAFMKELGEGHSKASLTFGYNLSIETEGVSMQVVYGLTERHSKSSVIDLADFDGDKLKFADYNSFHRAEPVPTRAENLGRVIEHEFLGHALGGWSDNLGTSPGDNENKVCNPIRAELGLPFRISYGQFGLFGDPKDIKTFNYIRITDANSLTIVQKTLHF